MVAKYEKKLYYMEPSDAIKNGTSSAASGQSVTRAGVENVKVHHSLSNSSPAASLSTNLKTLQVGYLYVTYNFVILFSLPFI